MQAAPPAIEAIRVVKRYRGRAALSGVSVAVAPGDIHGVLGANGAGKTTLFRMILGLADADEGEVRVEGRGAGTASGPSLGGLAGFIDAPRFYPHLSGHDNLTVLAALDGVRAPRERVRSTLHRFGLGATARAKVATYSAGARQRLGLASVFLRDPRVVVLDEPTNALDAEGLCLLREALRQVAQANGAVVFSTHDLREALELCTRVTVLAGGAVAFSGSPDELRAWAPEAPRRLRTSDDRAAIALAPKHDALTLAHAEGGDGLVVTGASAEVDAYVLALGREGVAVRSLERPAPLLAPPDDAPALDVAGAAAEDGPPGSPSRALRMGRLTLGGVAGVVRAEALKLRRQRGVMAVVLACVLAPFAFVGATRVEGMLPTDSLFGRWVTTSGFAPPLVVLGFAALWAFPLLGAIVAGDIFASEDRFGTWDAILTRSRTRAEVFVGKAILAGGGALLFALLLGVASVLAGVLFVGTAPLVSLSGNELASGAALSRIAVAWLSVAPPLLGFSALAAAISVWTRSSAAGIGLPVLLGLGMQVVSLADLPYGVRRVLLTSAFEGWHGLFAEPRFYGPAHDGLAASAGYTACGLLAAYVLLRRKGGS